jgi:hypothetical protein
MATIKWDNYCCAECALAEVPTKDGGVLRLKQSRTGALKGMFFNSAGVAINAVVGVPTYKTMTPAEIKAVTGLDV